MEHLFGELSPNAGFGQDAGRRSLTQVLGLMKRKIHWAALFWLIVVASSTCALLLWRWVNVLNNPEDITCTSGGVAPPFCYTGFFVETVLICAVCAPIIGLLVHKAFFSKFSVSNRNAP